MTAFPPADISSFLQLNAGCWLTLRSLLAPDSDPDAEEPMGEPPEPVSTSLADSQSWHHADRGELNVRFLEPKGLAEWGGLEIAPPDQASLTLIFRKDGCVLINMLSGHWQLGEDGSLELELHEKDRIVKERIWFSKPNLRLRCSLEQDLAGQPGRASFSSEIRRLSRSSEATQQTPE